MGKSKDLATGETRFVNTAGDTMTGVLTVDGGSTDNTVAHFKSGTANTYIKLSDSSTTNGVFVGATNEDMTLWSNNTERMKIDGSGRVTMPNQPSFAAAVSANNWTTSSPADCPFDTELYDIGGHYNTSNYTFTAPVAGRYFTSFFLNRYTDSRFDMAFLINGSARHVLEVREAGAGQWHMESAQVILSLSANDAVKLRITSVITTGSAIFDGGGTLYDVFSMHLLG